MTHRPESLLAEIGRELPFVDREEELALLKNLFDKTLTGNGQVVFVAGEGGIGKTRLVHELGGYAKGRGAIFAVGPSYEEEGLVPYSPWVEALRSIIRQHSAEMFGKALGQTLAEVGRLVPELAARAGELGIKRWLSGPSSFLVVSSTDSERIRLFQAVTDLLAYVARQRPVLLFLDDVLWADAASLQLLHYLCRRTKDHRLIVVAAYRDVELPEDHPLSRVLLDLNRERVLRRIVLGRLTPEHVAIIVSNHFNGPVARKFTQLIHERTGGNPFFVEEIVRSLKEDGRVHRTAEGWTLTETGEVDIPSTVRALVRHRMSRLGPETVQLLSAGAAIGMDFGYELVKRVAGLDDDKAMGLLEAALRAGLVREKRDGSEVSYVFSDEQIREYLYSELSLIRRRKTHARIAQAMEELRSDEGRRVEELAFHSVQAGDAAKALKFSMMAGEHAILLHAYPEAKKHFQNVLDMLEEDDNPERLKVLARLGDSGLGMGDFDQCSLYYRDALSIAGQLGDNRRTAQIYSKLGYAHWLFKNNITEGLRCYERGLEALQHEKDAIEEAVIVQNIARLLVNTGRVENALQKCEQAVRVARKLDAREVLAHALQTLALGLIPDRTNKDRIFNYLQESLKICKDNGLEDPLCRAHENLGMALGLVRADYLRSKETSLDGIAYAKKLGQVFYEAWTQAALALYALIPLGEWDKAVETASNSLRIGSEIGELLTARPIIPMALVRLYRGEVDEAEEMLSRASKAIERSDYRETMYMCYQVLGKLYTAKEDFEKAEEFFHKAIKAGSEFTWSTPLIETYFDLFRICHSQGRVQESRELHGKIRRAAADLDEKWGYAYEHWASGILALERNEIGEAASALRNSAELWKDLRHTYNHAQTTLDTSKALLRAGRKQDADEYIAEARKLFSRLGANLDLERLDSQ